MHGAQTVAALRALLRSQGSRAPIGHDRVSLGVAGLDQALGGGLARGAAHEVYASTGRAAGAATGFTLGLARRLMGKDGALVWLLQSMAAREYGGPYAPGLAETGLDPGRLVIVETRGEEDLLEAALQTLRGLAAGGVALLEPYGAMRRLDLTAGRKLALAAESSGASLLLLKTAVTPVASVAASRWLVHAERTDGRARHLMGRPRLSVELLRNRQGGTGLWSLEWDNDESFFRHAPVLRQPLKPDRILPEPLRGVVAPFPADRSAGADPAQEQQREQRQGERQEEGRAQRRAG